VLRKAFQQLEAAGFVLHDKTGRRVSPQGASFLDGVAMSLKPNAMEGTPELARY
jgi:small subunit ribosomal protein S19e